MMPDTRSNPPVDPPAVRRSGDADDQITLSSDRPAPGQIVIEVGGEVDMLTSPQLRAAVLEQFGEYAKGLGFERDRLPVAVQLVPYGTQAEAVEVIALRTIHRRSIQVLCSVLPASTSCVRGPLPA